MSNFINPTPNAKLTSSFGWRTIANKREWHQGIDLAQQGNVLILAAADGVVREIWGEKASTYGNVIFLQHNINGKRMDTTYAHLKSFSVKKGDKVKQGQIIGYMGNTGRSSGQHLHFEIHDGPWVKGQPNAVDPWSLIFGMKVSQNGIDLVKKWEGFQAKAYKCQAGIWTVGYGTTKYTNGQAVKGGDTITQVEALKLLEKQVNEHAATIQKYVTVSLTQNQFDALASFQYNLGPHILKNSTLLTYLNAKQWDKAAEEMKRYNKAAGKVSTGLVNRRNDEVALFLKCTSTTATARKSLKSGAYENEVDAKKAIVAIRNKYKLSEQYNYHFKDGNDWRWRTGSFEESKAQSVRNEIIKAGIAKVIYLE